MGLPRPRTVRYFNQGGASPRPYTVRPISPATMETFVIFFIANRQGYVVYSIHATDTWPSTYTML